VKWFTRLKERRQRYREVFGGGDGKWVLADLANACGFAQDPHTPGDSHTTSYLVGRHFMVLHIRSILDMSDAEMAVLVKQQEEAERRKDEDIFDHE
jgi:hypothetical protein